MVKKLIRALPLLFAGFLLTACNDNALLNNLTQDQANQVLAILQQHNIAAYKNGTLKSGYTVSVNASETTAALSVIKQNQLPWPPDVQISQAFPDSALVTSPIAEQARIISLQEQRLEQTLRVISEVVNARVHISYPSLDNSLTSNKYQTHVAVLISYKGEIDHNIFISQIKSLIKNSLENVRYEDISVVLFKAENIQFAQPTKVPTVLPSIWSLLLSIIAVVATATAGYLLYKTSQRPRIKQEPPVEKDSKELSGNEH